MNKIKTGILIVLLAAVCFNSYGQGAKSLKINEVLIKNTENFQDDYGQRNAWIEMRGLRFSTLLLPVLISEAATLQMISEFLIQT